MRDLFLRASQLLEAVKRLKHTLFRMKTCIVIHVKTTQKKATINGTIIANHYCTSKEHDTQSPYSFYESFARVKILSLASLRDFSVSPMRNLRQNRKISDIASGIM